MPKTVQFSNEAYRTLAALKHEGESLSDVVRRIAAERKDPLALLKLRKRKPRGREFEEFRRKMAAADRARFEEVWRRRHGRSKEV